MFLFALLCVNVFVRDVDMVMFKISSAGGYSAFLLSIFNS